MTHLDDMARHYELKSLAREMQNPEQQLLSILEDAPDLLGSSKQKEWAESLRLSSMLSHPEEVYRYLGILTESSWWIDNRGRVLSKGFWRALTEKRANQEVRGLRLRRLYASAKYMKERYATD